MTTRTHVVFYTALGVSLAAALAAWAGAASTLDALQEVGWIGLTWVCLLQLLSLILCALGLQCVAPGTSFGACLAARWVRDGTSNVLGGLPGFGEVAGARALTLLGAATALAASCTVADVAVEAVSQALYTLMGLVPLFSAVEADDRLRWLGAAAFIVIPIASVYLMIRNQRMFAMIERLIAGSLRVVGCEMGTGSLTLAHDLRALFRQRDRIVLAILAHTLAWIVGAVQVWAAARAMGRPIAPDSALALESLAYAARGALFIVPLGAGIQEGSFVLIGALLGIDAVSAMALSLVLRARDLLIGLPAIVLWAAAEGRRLLESRSTHLQ